MTGQVNLAWVLAVIITAIVTFILGYLLRKYLAGKQLAAAETKAKLIIDEASKEAETRKKQAELDSKDMFYRLRTEFEKETKDRRQEIAILEKRIIQKEENLDRRLDLIDKKEKDVARKDERINSIHQSLSSKESQLDKIITEEKDKLQKISGLSVQDAQQLLLSRLEEELVKERAELIRKYDEETKLTCDKKARKIVSLAIQRCSAEHTTETTVSVVALPSDDMKGRIIGREGRNIRALEMATGVDVIIDDTPEAVTLSAFDPIRREIARQSLERLISDGRIHPGRIEEVVEKIKKEMEETLREEGEKAAFDVGIHGLSNDLLKTIGRLKYRTSYGQNALQHSKEVAYLMGVMASEMGMDFKAARRIGFLHDLGKSVDHEIEGTHAKIGAELAKKFGESKDVINAIESHHEEAEPQTVYAVLVAAADAISASRPGARRETLESYVKRLEKLESIADSFQGVEKAFAIQAGREIRVIVESNKVNDELSVVLSRDIRQKIEEDLEYPGQIKVTVIRETRAIEYAK